MDEIQQDAPQQGLSRRTVVAGAAWAVPVIAVASAAPMAAAASDPVPTGAEISAANFSGGLRGARINLVDENLNGVPYPSTGATITLTVTGSGTLAGLSNITGGSFSPPITDLTAGTYTIIATPGANNFNFRGTLSGSLTLQASIAFVDSNNVPQELESSSTIISA